MKKLFALLTLVAAVRRWSSDLVESRRRLRAFVVVAGCAYTAAMVALRLNAGHGMLAAPAALVVAAIDVDEVDPDGFASGQCRHHGAQRTRGTALPSDHLADVFGVHPHLEGARPAPI